MQRLQISIIFQTVNQCVSATKTFLRYFHLGRVYFCEVLPICWQLQLRVLTNFGRFILLFTKMALIPLNWC